MAAFDRAQWSWPKEMDSQGSPGSADSQPRGSPGPAPNHPQPEQHETHTDGPRQKHYNPRTCRICLEVVQPVTEIEESSTGFFSPKVRVRYVSEDPESGRLISPCKCKGSQKYVHEGCLQAWRRSAPLSDRNYWSCPTCKFQYRMSRLMYGRWLGSWWTRAALTVMVMVVSLFILGFVADPIISLWLDPVGSVTDAITGVFTDVEGLEPLAVNDRPFSLNAHLAKGFVTLGLVGFVKTVIASPIYWVRWGLGGLGGRRRRGRRDIDDLNWYYIGMGLLTLVAVSPGAHL
jgi:hypothetical protein